MFIDNLHLFSLLANVADAKSLVDSPGLHHALPGDSGGASRIRASGPRHHPPVHRHLSFNLLPMFTAEQNILMPLTLAGAKPDRQWLRLLVETLGLKERLNHRPNELSGGQQQRVAIARALITKPKLVFADEPTGNLDSVSSAEVLSFLKRSVNELGQTIIMVTHDAVAASYADRALVFADGQIVADVNKPTADQMSELLMKEREAATMNVASARHSR